MLVWEVPYVDINAVGSFVVPITFVKDEFRASPGEPQPEQVSSLVPKLRTSERTWCGGNSVSWPGRDW